MKKYTALSFTDLKGKKRRGNVPKVALSFSFDTTGIVLEWVCAYKIIMA